MEVNAKSPSRSHYPLLIPLIECVPVTAEQRRRERGRALDGGAFKFGTSAEGRASGSKAAVPF